MTPRTDIPVMYDGECVYATDAGTLAAIVFREVPADHAWQVALACDCWAVDATGAPTGVAIARLYATYPRSQASDVDALLDAITAARLDELQHECDARNAIAASSRIRSTVTAPALAVEVPHPLDTTPEQLAADLAALPDPYSTTAP